MSWKAYQSKLGVGGPGRRIPRLRLWAALGCFAVLVYLLFGVRWFDTAGAARVAVPPSKPGSDEGEKTKWRGVLSAATLEPEVRFQREGVTYTAELSIRPDLQNAIAEKLRRFKVDWAGVAVVDPSTGAVLALVSHSEKEPSTGNLALRATFPAASVFKIVTAAAALEEGGYNRDSTVSFSGNMYGIGPRQVMKDSGTNGLTLSEAFGKSANIVFGKIAARSVDSRLLTAYAGRFGFNAPIPFDLDVGLSSADVPEDNVTQEARAAAGFGNVTLSPLHGALLAGTILNEGQMMEPWVIRRIVTAGNRTEYESRPRVWKTPISAVTAREMRRMMLMTIEEGTARRVFRHAEKDRILRNLQLGGKTGSLTGKNPPGRTEWFVGYARSEGTQIAVGIAVVNDRVWRVKPAELAREIYEVYFTKVPTMEASVRKERAATVQ